MIANVDKLGCYGLSLLSKELWSDLYDIECEKTDWERVAVYLWIANQSDCDIPFDTQCAIENVITHVDIDIPTQTDSTDCDIVLTRTPAILRCTSTIILRSKR